MNEVVAIVPPIIQLASQLLMIGLEAWTKRSEDSASILATVNDAIANFTATVNNMPATTQANDTVIDTELKAEAEKTA